MRRFEEREEKLETQMAEKYYKIYIFFKTIDLYISDTSRVYLSTCVGRYSVRVSVCMQCVFMYVCICMYDCV